MFLATALLAMLSSQPSEIVLRERLLPVAVHTTVISQCGGEEVSIRMENIQGRVGGRVTEIAIGDDMLSDHDLDRLAGAIGSRDIVSAAVVACGEDANLDKVSILIEMANRHGYNYRFVSLEITDDGVTIETA